MTLQDWLAALHAARSNRTISRLQYDVLDLLGSIGALRSAGGADNRVPGERRGDFPPGVVLPVAAIVQACRCSERSAQRAVQRARALGLDPARVRP